MQIDFHFGVTYIASRISGFSKEESHIIASSAQYVDDAIHEGMLRFTNRASYKFIASAHKMLDYRNFEELANKYVWIPFHFLPGNEVDQTLQGKASNFEQQLVCRPHSQMAKDLVKVCIANKNKEFGLYFLGTALHTFADTWAHQGFCGITSHINKVGNIFNYEGHKDLGMHQHRREFFQGKYVSLLYSFLTKFNLQGLFDYIKSKIVNEVSPIGHGSVLSYPDLPFKKWQYENWNGDIVVRDNPKDFYDATLEMIKVLQIYKWGQEQPVNQGDLDIIKAHLEEITHETGEKRLEVWIQLVRDGYFTFGSEEVHYTTHGENSWLFKSLGFHSNENFEFEDLHFKEEFMDSHWKRLHDALAFHNFTVLHDLLPQHGISAS